MERVYNFAAGPSAMPLEVLKKAQEDLVCYPGAGCSVMEMSHRSKSYQDIIDRAEATLRRLMDIPEDYSVLFLQGGASMQFSQIPMNLAKRGAVTDYIITGHFANKSYQEAVRWTDARIAKTSKEDKFSYIPKFTAEDLDSSAAYVHITGNNTIYGSAYRTLPDTGNIPLVADWSSALLGMQVDVSKHALIYAGAQKNIGPAGLTVVIVKNSAVLPDEDLDPAIPTMLRYSTMMGSGSMYNTPPCWAIYMSGLMFEWVENQGGVAEMEKRNTEKANILYDIIDDSKIYKSSIAKEDRSIMNVTFTLPTDEDTAEFLDLCKRNSIINVKGHRVLGGIRASIYNGVTIEAVNALAKVMKEFEAGRL